MTKRKYPEDDAQRALVQWLDLAHPATALHTIHVPNGGRRSAAQAGIFKALGVRAGVPDIICFQPCGPFAGLAIEIKAPGAVPSQISQAQREWIVRLRRVGWRAEAAAGFDAARAIFDSYLSGRPAVEPWGF